MGNLDKYRIEYVAQNLGVKKSAISMWHQRQMPWKWRLILSEHFKITPAELIKSWKAG